MIKIGILGDIGSGKSFAAKAFGYPVFNADEEVSRLYRKDRKVYLKLKRKLPKYISTFPIKKKEISKAIISKKTNLKKIIKIVHIEIRKKMKLFINQNKNKKIVILDIPLLLENKINQKKDILIFVDSKKSQKVTFLPLFFSKEYEAIAKPNQDFLYGLSFVGTVHSDRYDIISKIREQLIGININTEKIILKI